MCDPIYDPEPADPDWSHHDLVPDKHPPKLTPEQHELIEDLFRPFKSDDHDEVF
jgi:hypothetical protein